MTRTPRVLLIGGTSHVGKSTVARVVADRLGWEWQSTDMLARHPGRPWQTAPGREEFVAAHYTSLSVDELVADVLRHYRETVWPLVERIVAERLATDPRPGLVLEGSAVLPDLVAELDSRRVGAAWLVADGDLVRRRIHSESGYAAEGPRHRELVDKFLARTIRFGELLEADMDRLGFTAINVDLDVDSGKLAEMCLAMATRSQG